MQEWRELLELPEGRWQERLLVLQQRERALGQHRLERVQALREGLERLLASASRLSAQRLAERDFEGQRLRWTSPFALTEVRLEQAQERGPQAARVLALALVLWRR